jgi:hypothetical protein
VASNDIIKRFKSAQGSLQLFLREGKPAIELLTANPLAGFCLALNADIKQPAELSPLSAAHAYVTKPQREILAWLGFTPATEAVAKIGRKCVPESLSIARCRGLRQALRHEDVRQMLAHLPRINAGVMGLVSNRMLLPYLTPQLLLEVANNATEDTRSDYAQLLTDIYELEVELCHEAPTQKCSSKNEMRTLHQKLIEEIVRSGGRYYKQRIFPSPPLLGVTTNDLTIMPITKIGELQALGREQHNCVAAYARRISSGECYIYRVAMKNSVCTLCITQKDGGAWQISELESVCNKPAPEEVVHVVQQWLDAKARAVK